jgi:hypothetical protein
VTDLSNASQVAATSFHITKVSAGSVIVDAEILPQPSGRGPDPQTVALNLTAQSQDPHSPLRSGILTRHVTTVTQGNPSTPLHGARVRVHGLRNNVELNNCSGTVMGAADEGRFRVLLEVSRDELSIKPENFSVLPGQMQMHQQVQAGIAAETDKREVEPLSAPSGAPIEARLYQQAPPQVNSHNLYAHEGGYEVDLKPENFSVAPGPHDPRLYLSPNSQQVSSTSSVSSRPRAGTCNAVRHFLKCAAKFPSSYEARCLLMQECTLVLAWRPTGLEATIAKILLHCFLPRLFLSTAWHRSLSHAPLKLKIL